VALLALWCCLGEASGGTISAKGSDTLVILMQRWAAGYAVAHPETRLQVTGGGTGVGLAALQNRTTDLATASRRIKAREVEGCVRAFGRRPTEYKVALDGLCIYVHESNPLSELSLDQLESIFTGRVRNWREVGGAEASITVYSRENSSGAYGFFKEHVLRGADFGAATQTMPGTAALSQAVARDKLGIGYGGAAFGGGVKCLSLRRARGEPAVAPTRESVMAGRYPIWRYLYIYVNPDLDRGEVAAFLGWIRSAEGQRCVEAVGYYPLPPEDAPPAALADRLSARVVRE
jgi:phosphate transport system substrate-binding protein